MTQLEDGRIIDLFFERSEQAVDELDKKYGALIAKTASNFLRSRQDVEECVNDTYLGVWNSIPPHRPDPLISYVCRIARNLAVSKLRSETAEKRSRGLDLVFDELAEIIPSGQDVEKDYEVRELMDGINHFLETLPYDDRYLFVRRYWYADPVKEIAAATHLRENRISLRLFRLRKQLRRALEKEGLLV